MSKPPSQNMTSLKGAHTRNLSGNTVPKQDFKVPKRPSVFSKPEIHYTALIRLPFARGDFVDPPQVDWNATKDRALWKIISRSPKTSELDWEDLATKFQVSPTFMLQQAAWLYERHLSHVRAQMKKVGSSNATNSGSGSAHATVGGVPMKRLGSGGAGASRTPSALSIRSRDSPIPRGDTSTPGTPRTAAPPLSRTPSTNTVTQSRAHLPAASPRAQLHRSFRSSFPPPQKPTPPPALSPSTEPANQPSDPASPATSALSSSSTSDSSSGEDTNNPLHRSQLFKRPPRFRAQKPRGLATLDDEDQEGDDEGDSNTFLPFAHTSRLGTAVGDAASPTTEDPSATLRDKILLPPEHVRKYLAHDMNKAPVSATFAQGQGKDKGKGKGKEPAIASSATSSASDAPSRGGHGFSPSALSPRHRAELARLSPRSAAGGKREGSDGTPSMGSSFSDLDDSITQSALEEALLSNIQHGRMSTLSQLRSRYL